MLQKHTVIIGAGISGLTLGWSLKHQKKDGNKLTIYQKKDGNKLTILESSKRPGGWIQTKNEDGFLFEQGPRSFRSGGTGIATLQLIEHLGLQNELLFANKAAKIRYIYTDNKLQSLPTGLLSTLYSPFFFKFLKGLWTDCLAARCQEDDETIYTFAKRRFGAQMAELFFDPLISGIYAGDIKKLSLKSCFPSLHVLESQHRSLFFGALSKKKPPSVMVNEKPLSSFVEHASRQGIFTLRNGIETLTDKLAENLKEELRLDSPVKRLTFENGKSCIELLDGQRIIADELHLAIPPNQLAPLFKTSCETIYEQLNLFETASISVINCGYHYPVLNKKGFGYLVPSKEKQKLLGVVWDSSAFPEQNAHSQQTRLTAMIGGAHFANFSSFDESALIELALKELHCHLGIRKRPDCILFKRAHEAIPQYTVGHTARVAVLKHELKKLPAKVSVLGNGYHGVSVNDCVAYANVTGHCSEL
ncbi:MAG: protoporphyrinogen oxidase [Parachlamydiaceae bacterium]|nr:protoporphyrinogen oxidase [Parachlamydiaceae bacterium]